MNRMFVVEAHDEQTTNYLQPAASQHHKKEKQTAIYSQRENPTPLSRPYYGSLRLHFE